MGMYTPPFAGGGGRRTEYWDTDKIKVLQTLNDVSLLMEIV